jgi:hypothetical protein
LGKTKLSLFSFASVSTDLHNNNKSEDEEINSRISDDSSEMFRLIINTLLYGEILDKTCLIKYAQLCKGKIMHEVKADELYEAFIQENVEDKSAFLEHLLNWTVDIC